jgi:ATP-binding cassette subfamily F protein 3
VKAAEAEVTRLNKQRGDIDQALHDPESYRGTGHDVAALMKSRAELDQRIEAAESRWLEASEALEQAQGVKT